MTTLHEHANASNPMRINPAERRKHKRHGMDSHAIEVMRLDRVTDEPVSIGTIQDLSASGLRIRTTDKTIGPDNHIRVKINLPTYAGICPFVDTRTGKSRPTSEWIGWVAVKRVNDVDMHHRDVAGQLLEISEMDRGMLGLYLSTQPLAA